MDKPAPFRERLTWDAVPGQIRDGDVRYMLIRPDALMAVFRTLSPAARAEAFEALRGSIGTYGSRSAANYARTATRPLVEVVAETAPQLGWGRWSVEHGDDGTIRVAVSDSPFAAGHGTSDTAVCTAITGMLGAVGGLMADHPTSATETCCAAVTGEGICRFEIRKVTP